ncbi:hypothetical protein AMTRI_Chr13g121570 [Amborella trichopoda]
MPYHKEVYHNFDCEASKQSIKGMRPPLQSNIAKRRTAVSTVYPTPDRMLLPPIVPSPRITITSRPSWPPFFQLSHTTHSPLKPPSYTLTSHVSTSYHAFPYVRPRYHRVCPTTLPSGVTPML